MWLCWGLWEAWDQECEGPVAGGVRKRLEVECVNVPGLIVVCGCCAACFGQDGGWLHSRRLVLLALPCPRSHLTFSTPTPTIHRSQGWASRGMFGVHVWPACCLWSSLAALAASTRPRLTGLDSSSSPSHCHSHRPQQHLATASTCPQLHRPAEEERRLVPGVWKSVCLDYLRPFAHHPPSSPCRLTSPPSTFLCVGRTSWRWVPSHPPIHIIPLSTPHSPPQNTDVLLLLFLLFQHQHHHRHPHPPSPPSIHPRLGRGRRRLPLWRPSARSWA